MSFMNPKAAQSDKQIMRINREELVESMNRAMPEDGLETRRISKAVKKLRENSHRPLEVVKYRP